MERPTVFLRPFPRLVALSAPRHCVTRALEYVLVCFDLPLLHVGGVRGPIRASESECASMALQKILDRKRDGSTFIDVRWPSLSSFLLVCQESS